MYFGEDFVNEVNDRTDIVDLVSSYVNIKKKGKDYVGLCPFHNEKTPSFYVVPGKQIYYCFGCGQGGNVYSFLMNYENVSFTEAVEQLAERAGLKIPEGAGDRSGEAKKREIKDRIFEINTIAAKLYYSCLKSESGKEGYEYFRKRGLSDEDMTRFGLGFATKDGRSLYKYMKNKGYSDDILKQTGLFVYDEKRGPYDKFWNRVMFPIMDRRGRVIGFGGRVMGDGKPKYLNSPETVVFDKGKNLYGMNYVHGKVNKGIILCEGYMDVIALHRMGYTNAVAALGTAFTESQCMMIKRFTEKVYLCFDSDGAGVKAALRAIPTVKSVGLSISVIDLSPCKDPDEFFGEFSVEDFDKRIKDAENSFFFEARIAERDYDMNDPEGKTRFMNEMAKKILGFESDIERANYIDAFARKYGVRSEDFKSLVAHQSAALIGRSSAGSHKDDDRVDLVKNSSGIAGSEELLLSWLSEHPEKFGSLKEMVKREDYVDEPYRQIADLLYDQLEKNNKADPSAIISHLSGQKDQSVAAKIFSKEMTGEKEEKRAIGEVVKKILANSIDHRSRNVTDLNELMKIREDKKRLQEMIWEE